MLIGRDEERRRIAALFDHAKRGRSGVLSVVGDPGVGKTALLEDAADAAPDFRRIGATGVESESELAFASLHETLRPLLGLLPQLPPPQAQALARALALEEGDAAPLAVAAGVLSLLVEAADERPLLLVLDDVQWLDAASAEALVFAVRRLRAETIVVLSARRPRLPTPFEELPALELTPLDGDSARALLRERRPLAAADEARVVRAADGNPLALLELPVDLIADEPSSASATTARLDRAFAHRLDRLPEQTRRVLLLAAAEPDAAVVTRAVGEAALDALAPAETAGLLHTADGQLTFRHPLVRSLVYARATTGDRAEAHRALAAVLPGADDDDRRVWHLAAAAAGPDEEVARALEETADRALARGGHAAAMRTLERAARLSTDRASRARRFHSAARSRRRGGDAASARALLDEALTYADDPSLRFELLFERRVLVEWTADRESDDALLAELRASDGLTPEQRVKLLLFVLGERLNRFDVEGALEVAPEMVEHALACGVEGRWRGKGMAAAAYLLAGDRARAEELFEDASEQPTGPAMLAFDYLSLERHDELRESLRQREQEARGDGNVMSAAWNQGCVAHLELRHGRLAAAEEAALAALHATELVAFAKGELARGALAAVYAWRGDETACREATDRAASAARVADDALQEGLAVRALGLLHLGLGSPADAVRELTPFVDRWRTSRVGDPAALTPAIELIEALAATRAEAAARELLDWYGGLAAQSGCAWARGSVARCEGLLAEAFEEPFERSVELLEESPYRLDLARTHLALGERRRRAGRRRDAREPLERAHALFAASGATAWQRRAAAELRAVGVRPHDAAEPTWAALTPQESEIVRLVRDGRSNKEVAAALYLSPKTIEYHLGNVFRKLGIHSRVELARLRDDD